MRDEPARDAVKRGLLDTFRGAWTDSEYEATFGPAADAVLAALGIPPNADVDDVRAGLFLLQREGVEHKQIEREAFTARHTDALGTRTYAYGASPAAAVLALAARLDER